MMLTLHEPVNQDRKISESHDPHKPLAKMQISMKKKAPFPHFVSFL